MNTQLLVLSLILSGFLVAMGTSLYLLAVYIAPAIYQEFQRRKSN